MLFHQTAVLVGSIVFIVWATAYRKINAFFVLLVAALGVGVLSGVSLTDISGVLRAAFGHTMEKIGLLILLGTVLGVILEKTGATISMANAILRFVKEKNTAAAISLTGFVVGLPIFCDSGFIILSGLNHSLVARSHYRMPVMGGVLATSLYGVHCLVPPHPGITAATGTLGGDLGMVMLLGIVFAIPATLVGYFWSTRRGAHLQDAYLGREVVDVEVKRMPRSGPAFFPVMLPIVLIAGKSIMDLFPDPANDTLVRVLAFLGDPVIALGAGILVAMPLVQVQHRGELSGWLTVGVEKAGIILAIIGAGGMFGGMLQATGSDKNLGALLGASSLGIFFPFLITAVLKTAQGSSTVAVITASSLVASLMPALGLDSPIGITLGILSMGAGSMMVSHANDAYFWVISRFSNLETSATLKVYSVATILMAVATQLMIWVTWILVR